MGQPLFATHTRSLVFGRWLALLLSLNHVVFVSGILSLSFSLCPIWPRIQSLGSNIFFIATNFAGSESDKCNLELEELWCCQYAKERPVEDLISTSISALSLNVSKKISSSWLINSWNDGGRLFDTEVCNYQFNMRYRGAGLDCETLDNPEVNNLGRSW